MQAIVLDVFGVCESFGCVLKNDEAGGELALFVPCQKSAHLSLPPVSSPATSYDFLPSRDLYLNQFAQRFRHLRGCDPFS